MIIFQFNVPLHRCVIRQDVPPSIFINQLLWLYCPISVARHEGMRNSEADCGATELQIGLGAAIKSHSGGNGDKRPPAQKPLMHNRASGKWTDRVKDGLCWVRGFLPGCERASISRSRGHKRGNPDAIAKKDGGSRSCV